MPRRYPKELKKRWSYFIRKVYETDPLICPKCQGEMRIISFIDQPGVIKKILQHIGLWEESHAPPERDPPIKRDYLRSILQFDRLTVPSKVEGQPQPKADPPQVEANSKKPLFQSGVVVQPYPA
jgi:hypothetical protein